MQIPQTGQTITEHLLRFRRERSVVALARVVAGVLRQGRTREVLYGMLCAMAARRSIVRPGDTSALLAALHAARGRLADSTRLLTRADLIGRYGDHLAMHELPEDFEGARLQAVAMLDNRVVVGEYGRHSARIAVVSEDACEVFAPYAGEPGVRHIHLVVAGDAPNELFVTTGDCHKMLDRVVLRDGKPYIVERCRRQLAGHTGAARAGGDLWFGTDFSGRPNYIETLGGQRFYLPAQAFTQWVGSLVALDGHHLALVGMDIRSAPSTVTVFDAGERVFVLCASIDEVLGPVRPGEDGL